MLQTLGFFSVGSSHGQEFAHGIRVEVHQVFALGVEFHREYVELRLCVPWCVRSSDEFGVIELGVGAGCRVLLFRRAWKGSATGAGCPGLEGPVLNGPRCPGPEGLACSSV